MPLRLVSGKAECDAAISADNGGQVPDFWPDSHGHSDMFIQLKIGGAGSPPPSESIRFCLSGRNGLLAIAVSGIGRKGESRQ